MYADDHQVHSAGQTANEVRDTINEEGKEVSKWYESDLLKGSFSKYQAISFGPKNKSKDLNIALMSSTIEQYPQITLLGVTIDDKLTFESHVSSICKKASRQVGVISRLRNMIPTKAKLQIFNQP